MDTGVELGYGAFGPVIGLLDRRTRPTRPTKRG